MRTYYIRFKTIYRNEETERVEFIKCRTSTMALGLLLKKYPKGTKIKLLESKIVTTLN